MRLKLQRLQVFCTVPGAQQAVSHEKLVWWQFWKTHKNLCLHSKMYKYREGLGGWLSWESDCLAHLKTWMGFSEFKKKKKAVWSACYLRTAKEPRRPSWTLGLTGQSVNSTVRIPGRERDLVQTNKQIGKKHVRKDTWVNLWLPYMCVHNIPPMATHTSCIYKKKAARACHLDMAYNTGNEV